MRTLLIVTAVLEAGTGLALTLSPSMLVAMLLGTALDTPSGLAVGRLAGAALLSLGSACWLAHKDAPSRAVTGLIAAMVLYNAAVAAVLAYAGLGSGLIGIALWPAVLLHMAMLVWCIACLRGKRIDLVK